MISSDHKNACSQLDDPWTSGRVPNGFWESRENRVLYMDWLGRRLGFANPEDWYQSCNSHFTRNHGRTLLQKTYHSSVQIAVQDYQPHYEWIPWLFSKIPKGFWLKARNRHAYLEWLSRRLGFHSEEDWYQLTNAAFIENHGCGLLMNHYRGSILSALHDYRPDYDWKPWVLSKVPRGFWSVPDNRKRYFQWLAERLTFDGASDWKSLTKQDLYETGAAGLFVQSYGGSLTRIRDDVMRMNICKAV